MAMLLWRRMKEENVTVPRATYNALLHAAQGSLTENATSALLAAMDRDGVALNVVSYNVALNSLAKQGRFSEVLSLLEAMESASIKPTDVSLKRRERVETLARAAISRNRAAVDDDRLKRDEDILGMVLQNRRVEV